MTYEFVNLRMQRCDEIGILPQNFMIEEVVGLEKQILSVDMLNQAF